MAEEESKDRDHREFTIKLGNQDFVMRRELWDVDRLKLDPNNQRLGFLLRKKGVAANDAELHKLLWELDPVKELHQSIYQNGGLIEDPYVREDGTVVEGNCRTVALRELSKKYPKEKKFQKVFVRVLPGDVSDEQLMLLLGELHVAGRIEWKAFDQAEYVWKMNKVFGRNFDYLASHLRWSRSKLTQTIAAYEEARAYMSRTGDSDVRKYSYFEEFMKKRELRDRRESDPDFMIQFGTWMTDGRFRDARDVRELPAVLENKEALQKFIKADLKEARTVLYKENPALVSNLYSTVDMAAQELETVSLQEIGALQAGDQARLAKLQRLKAALDRIQEFAKIKL